MIEMGIGYGNESFRSSSINYLQNLDESFFLIRLIILIFGFFAFLINRSELWGIFFARYNPETLETFFGSGPFILANHYSEINILDKKQVDFEFDGEMTAEVALDYNLIKENYPFCKLSGPANVLIMPDLYSANISFKLLQKMENLSVIGPIMIGGNNPFQIVQMGASVSDIVNSACISTYNSL